MIYMWILLMHCKQQKDITSDDHYWYLTADILFLPSFSVTGFCIRSGTTLLLIRQKQILSEPHPPLSANICYKNIFILQKLLIIHIHQLYQEKSEHKIFKLISIKTIKSVYFNHSNSLITDFD